MFDLNPGSYIGAAFGFVFCLMLGLDFTITLLLSVCFGFVGTLFYYGTIGKKQIEEQDAENAYFADFEGYGNLVIYSRAPELRNMLVMDPVIYIAHDKQDPMLVYTGATVGGIHTGGFHVQEGKTTSQRYKTDKYRLCCMKSGFPLPINRIRLSTSSMVAAAKKDPFISQYLDGDILTLKNKVLTNDYLTQASITAIQMGKYDAATNIASYSALDEALTQDQCNHFIQWLSSDTVSYSPPIQANGWQCSCGKTNASYTTSCSCGKSKREIMAQKNLQNKE